MIKSKVITEKDLAPYLEPLFDTIEQASERTRPSNILKYLGLSDNQKQLSEVQKSIKNLRKRYPEKSPQDESNRNEKPSQKSDESYHHIARGIG